MRAMRCLVCPVNAQIKPETSNFWFQLLFSLEDRFHCVAASSMHVGLHCSSRTIPSPLKLSWATHLATESTLIKSLETCERIQVYLSCREA